MSDQKKTLKIGQLHQHISYEDYAAQPGIRSSHLQMMKRSPAHYEWGIQNPKADTDAMAFGRVVHSMLENGERFLDTIKIEPEFTGLTKDGKLSKLSGEAKDKKAAWYADLKPGTEVVSQEEHAKCVKILRNISEHTSLKKLLKGGMREVSGWVQDDITGETLQFRPDIITTDGFIMNFKTTRDARPEYWWGKQGAIFGSKKEHLIVDAAHYAKCAKLLGLSKSDRYYYVAIENIMPCGLRIHALDDGHIDVGEWWRSRLTKKISDCKKTNTWPGYDEAAYSEEVPEYPDLPIEDQLYNTEGDV
ncbi:MAG: PD-(D/E)XK nuclease-like domain-containing protein [Chlamydiales bacterium]